MIDWFMYDNIDGCKLVIVYIHNCLIQILMQISWYIIDIDTVFLQLINSIINKMYIKIKKNM